MWTRTPRLPRSHLQTQSCDRLMHRACLRMPAAWPKRPQLQLPCSTWSLTAQWLETTTQPFLQGVRASKASRQLSWRILALADTVPCSSVHHAHRTACKQQTCQHGNMYMSVCQAHAGLQARVWLAQCWTHPWSLRHITAQQHLDAALHCGAALQPLMQQPPHPCRTRPAQRWSRLAAWQCRRGPQRLQPNHCVPDTAQHRSAGPLDRAPAPRRVARP